MPTTPRFGFALEYVTDIEAAKRFYVDVLGLQVERIHPTFVQFDRFAIASDESMTGGRDPELYWLVEDAEAALNAMAAKGEVVVPLRQMPFGRLFGIKGPAGRPCFVLELAKNRPSKAVS